MAIVTKNTKKGLDVVVDYLQEYSYAYLIAFWDNNAVYNSYPRANKNYKEDSLIPEISLDNSDYDDVLFNDNLAVTSFFLANNERIYNDDEDQIKQNISIIFQADLDALYGSFERLDEVFNSDVLSVFRRDSRYIFGDVDIVTGVDSVYSDLTLTQEMRDKVRLFDMSNRHVLKLSFDVIYDYRCAPSPSKSCSPATLLFNDLSWGTVLSGGIANIPVKYENGDIVPITINDQQEIIVPNTLTPPSDIGALTITIE